MSRASTGGPLVLHGATITLREIAEVAAGREVAISEAALARMQAAREAVLSVAESSEPVYGVNTGFGPLRDRRVPSERLAELQLNLVRSHAAGVGAYLAPQQVRAAMLLTANCHSHGRSGISPSIVQLLVAFLNKSIHPLVPSQGSLGASGDLAPLAHVALCLIGEGDVEHRGQRRSALEAMREEGLEPGVLGPKDGLSLINGTHFLTAVGALATDASRNILRIADVAAALHLEASLSSVQPFEEGVLALRPHYGVRESASNVRKLVEGSDLMASHVDCGEVQDAYAIRCVPQVHGAVRQAWKHTAEVIELETGSVTDNPVWLENRFVSAGNFHGEPCALAFDYLSLALVELGNISERRTERLLNPALSRGLPAFLTSEPGLQSGMMLAHYTAASLASENKTLAFPASADTIPTGANQEDHVSMGMWAARKLDTILHNVSRILAVELLVSARAVRMRMEERDMLPGRGAKVVLDTIETLIPFRTHDYSPSADITELSARMLSGSLLQTIEREIGELQ